jgi:FKBP-type peptidyl-prolyl cis-trans isomerase FkpA
MNKLVLALFLVTLGCSKPVDEPAKSDFVPAVIPQKLEIHDDVVGTGPEVKNGDKVKMDYVGTLVASGEEFDSSKDSGKPFEFTLGAQEVIKGWDQGVLGMHVGGKRTLIVPSDLAYGNEGNDKIPPGATLKFEIELLEIEP